MPSRATTDAVAADEHIDADADRYELVDGRDLADDHGCDHDVVIVGGGPAGCSAGVFTARYGLDTVVFDRGNSALRRCAYLTNYLGFPGGVGVDAFHDLMHAHAEDAGCTRIPELVESVERTTDADSDADTDADPGFVVETAAGRRVTTRYVVGAAWYDGSYLRGLGEDAMFAEQEHHGEVEERFDPDYPDGDGRTPVDGLYVAGPAGARSAQAIVAAGHGAHVARCLIEDEKRALGYAGGVAPHYDWLRPAAEFTGEWADRDRWREWFANEYGEDETDADPDADGDPDAVDDERFVALRERYLDRAFDTRVTQEAADERADRGIERLVAVLGTERVLDAVDDETIAAYLDGRPTSTTADGEAASGTARMGEGSAE